MIASAATLDVPGKGTEYYMPAGGAYPRLAGKGKTFLRYLNGPIEKKNVRPDPGTAIMVPSNDPEEERIDFVGLFSNLGQIFAATVIMVLTR